MDFMNMEFTKVPSVAMAEPEEEFRDEYEGFSITDDSAADWALRKIAQAEIEHERELELIDQRVKELEWLTRKSDSKFEFATRSLTAKLNAYFETVNHKETKTQESYELLSGKLIMKKSKSVITHDDEALLKYLKDNQLNDFIQEKPKWGDFKKTLTISEGSVISADGEVLECLSVETTEPEFSIKTVKEV